MTSPAHLVFEMFPWEDPRTPYKRYTWKYCISFLITPLLLAEDCVIMIQIIVIYLLSVCDCQILKTMIFLSVLYLFVACDQYSPQHLFFSYITVF